MGKADLNKTYSNPQEVSEKNPRYERYRPKRYDARMPIFWWTDKKPYVVFILRELTSLFIAAYAVLLIVQLSALNRGPEAYETLLAFFATPLSIVLHIAVFLVVIFHSITWFRLAPTAMVLRVGKKRISGNVIIAVNFLMWVVLSLAIAWLIISI